MSDKVIKMNLKNLATLLFIPEEELKSLLDKHQVYEERKRDFFWIPFLWVCFRCILTGRSRHKDRLAL